MRRREFSGICPKKWSVSYIAGANLSILPVNLPQGKDGTSGYNPPGSGSGSYPTGRCARQEDEDGEDEDDEEILFGTGLEEKLYVILEETMSRIASLPEPEALPYQEPPQ